MRRLTLKDGTVFENGMCGVATGVLWCYLKDVSFADALSAFANPEKTDRITFSYGEMEDVYEGYTRVISLNDDRYGLVSVALVQEDR